MHVYFSFGNLVPALKELGATSALGASGTTTHDIENKITFLFTHPEFVNQKRRYSHTLDELPLADITWIIVLIQFW